MFTKCDLQIDIEKLREAYANLNVLWAFVGTHNELKNNNDLEICLTHKEQFYDKWIDGCGVSIKNENDFKILNEELHGTYFEELHDNVQEYLKGKGTRFRLRNLQMKSNTSMHKDLELEKFHIAIHTNPNCFFVFNNSVFHLPADGHMYRLDTKTTHCAVNASFENRIHLVIEVENDL